MMTFLRSSWYNYTHRFIIVFFYCDTFRIGTYPDDEDVITWWDGNDTHTNFLLIDRASAEIVKSGRDSFRLTLVYILKKELFLNPPPNFSVISDESSGDSEVIQQGTNSFRLYIVYLLNKELFLNPPRHFEVSSNESGLKVLL